MCAWLKSIGRLMMLLRPFIALFSVLAKWQRVVPLNSPVLAWSQTYSATAAGDEASLLLSESAPLQSQHCNTFVYVQFLVSSRNERIRAKICVHLSCYVCVFYSSALQTILTFRNLYPRVDSSLKVFH